MNKKLLLLAVLLVGSLAFAEEAQTPPPAGDKAPAGDHDKDHKGPAKLSKEDFEKNAELKKEFKNYGQYVSSLRHHRHDEMKKHHDGDKKHEDGDHDDGEHHEGEHHGDHHGKGHK